MLKTLCRSQQTGKLLGLPVQGDEVEGCVLIFCKSSNIATSCWTTINRRMLKFIRKRYPHPKTKKKLQWDGRRGTITTKPNLIPSGWVTHRLENNNTKEVLILLWRFWIPHQSSQTGDLTKELGTPREYGLGGHWDLIISLPVDWGKQRLQSWRAKTTFFFFCSYRRGEVTSQETEPVTSWCWRVPHGGVGQQGLTTGTGHWKVPLGVNPFGVPY